MPCSSSCNRKYCATMSANPRNRPSTLLKALLHSHKCQRLENQSNGEVGQCSLPYCRGIKHTLSHMTGCSVMRSCPYPLCSPSRNVVTHFRNCTKTDCPVCFPVFQSADRQHQAGMNNASGSSTLLHENKILQDLKELFLNKDHCDVVLKVKGREFPVHKAILVARSPVFASMFRYDMKEKETGIVDIKDCDPSSFSDFLCFLYCKDTDSLSQENVFSLFTVADKYDVPDLKEKCIEFLKRVLSVDTFVETLTFAIQYADSELINFTSDFFIQNALNIIVTAKWRSFVVENPTQSEQFLSNL